MSESLGPISRQPANTNILKPTNFRMSFPGKSNTTYFCQETAIPGISIQPIPVNNRFVQLPIPGDQISFSQLTVTLLCDEEMRAYEEIFNWIIGLAYPENHQQRTDWIAADTSGVENQIDYTDGILQILTNNSNHMFDIRFIDCYPINIGDLSLKSSETSPGTGLVFPVTFAYTSFKFERPT